MRIALMPSAYAPAVGGVEELTRQIAEQLTSGGHLVEVWTIRHPATLPAAEFIDGIRVRRFPMPLPAARPANLLRFGPHGIQAVRAMLAAVREFRPDVLHVQCFSANGVYASILSRMKSLPLIVTLQGETVMDDRDIYERSVSLRLGLRAGLRQAHAVTACSQFVLDDAGRFGLAPGAGKVVPNGVSIRPEPAPVPLSLPFGRFVLGFGRVVEKKGFDLLIEAFARLASDQSLGLVIGGDGAALDGLRQKASALGLDARVVFPGTLSRGQIAWATANAAVFVMPSRIEPFGIVALEAMGAGCPVIVSSRGGASEVVRDCQDGLVIDPFDTAALASAIDRVLADTTLRTRLIEGALSRAQDFAWGPITQRYLDVYRDPGAS